jgi:hypothetical protein
LRVRQPNEKSDFKSVRWKAISLILAFMTRNLFLDRAQPPSTRQIAAAVGPRLEWLHELKGHSDQAPVEQWKYYGKSIGWTLKLLVGKRNLCFIVVQRGSFAVSFVFGDRAVRAIEQSDLPRALIARIVGARRYVEGRGVRLEITSRRVLEHAKKLLLYKQQPPSRGKRLITPQ